MDDEFAALQRQGTWTLVLPSSSHNLVWCKWVYKLKDNDDGNISRYKARLVAKGFHQLYGVDFEETFSHVIKLPTVIIMVLKTGTVKELENVLITGFMVGPRSDRWSNR